MSADITELSVSDVGDWQDLASRTFVPLQCQRRAKDFRATIRSIDVLRGFSIVDLHTGPVRVERPADLAGAGGDGSLLVIVQSAARSAVAQDGRRTVLEPGSAAVLDTTRPYEIVTDDQQRQLVARLQPRVPEMAVSWLSTLTARPISAAAPIVSVLHGVTASLECGGAMTNRGRQEIGGSTVDLLLSMLREEARTAHSHPSDAHAELRSQCTGYVTENAGDAALSVATLARAHHVSVRSLHAAFADGDDTPGALIRRERLRMASKLLDETNLPVTEIVRRCGFEDATTFARTFRRQFGMSASQYRSRSSHFALSA